MLSVILVTVCTVPWRNWNKIFFIFLFAPEGGLYRTLEELKYLLPIDCFQVVQVCTVPWRNWNSVTERALYIALQFVPYLGGIEILLKYWTLYPPLYCLYRTLEELKFYHLPYVGIPVFVCTVPWRNWNSFTPFSVPSLSHLFVPYLGGIEIDFA